MVEASPVGSVAGGRRSGEKMKERDWLSGRKRPREREEGFLRHIKYNLFVYTKFKNKFLIINTKLKI